jgi:hypothetical protein
LLIAIPTTSFVYGAALLADGQLLSWGADGNLQISDLMTGTSRMLVGCQAVTGVQILSDGRGSMARCGCGISRLVMDG